MPDMDGFEATQAIRQWEQEQDRQHPPTPICALTAHILPEHLDRCIASGMNDHLLKPVEMSKLRAFLLSQPT